MQHVKVIIQKDGIEQGFETLVEEKQAKAGNAVKDPKVLTAFSFKTLQLLSAH